jgi:hypothetical protein
MVKTFLDLKISMNLRKRNLIKIIFGKKRKLHFRKYLNLFDMSFK